MPGPVRHHLRDVVGVDLLLQVLEVLLQLVEASLRRLEPLLQLRDLAVLQLRGAVQVAGPRGALGLHAQPVQLLLHLAELPDRCLLALPLRLHPAGPLALVRDLLVHALQPLLALRVRLLGQRLPLDLQLRDPALDLVDLLWQRVDLDAQPAGRLVDQVDRLVRQEPVADVAVRERGGGHDRGVGDPHAVVHLVALLEPAQDRDGVLHARLAHEHRLEPPLQRRVLLDVLAVLVQRGRADHAQLAARQRRLQHVSRVRRALRLPRPHDGVKLVDEDDELPLAIGDLLEHRLEPLLELAAELGAREHGTDVQRDQRLVAQSLGHVAADDPLREPLHDRGLADAGLADQHRVVLGPPREHLHHAPDLLVPADHRVQLAAPRALGQVDREALQRLVLRLRRLVRHAVRAANLLQRLQQRLARGALRREQVSRRRALPLRQPEQQVLRGDVLVLEVPGLLLGTVQDLVQLARDRRLRAAVLRR
jgi:hypothetical protein